ncbi:winged helix-turn-helix transcriptional regulator [Spirochaeta cellobiosiphila]|uniref:winged helix-turn-helix transcriptional regulator n=1 Tax=Spirochaeta cellobiosiphila TaxID=504483 RepID=UPI000415CDD0|nr:helix-turn-helix domain-containing protein [Spirochaeta cellobiosiphila]
MKKEEFDYNVFYEKCISRGYFEQITSRWAVLILAKLGEGEFRFRELYRAIQGISERMLSKNLKSLEQLKLVYRSEAKDDSNKVTYGLSESGKRLSQSLMAFIEQLYTELDNM